MLRLKNISKTYGKKEVLHNINVNFDVGIYGLIGKNGAGKSTIMNIMADVLDASSGEVLFNGKNILTLGGEYRKNIGFLPQNVGYYGNFTAEKTVQYFATLRGVEKDKIVSRTEEVLKSVNLFNNRKEKVKTFSGGMKQRLGIAVTTVADPALLIFDEPTVGLDPEERERFKNMIKKLGKEKTIILSTHIISDVEEVADYIVFMENGEIANIKMVDRVGEKDVTDK